MPSIVRRVLRVSAAAVIALSTSGCFQFSSVLTIRGDGSGTIQQRLLLTPTALSQLRSMAILRGNANGGEAITAEQAAAAATLMGPGVTYTSSTPITTADGQGRDILYSFTDINLVRLSELPSNPGGVSMRAQGLGTGDQVSFALAQGADGNAVLRINIPKPPFASAGAPASGERRPVPIEQLAVFKPMLAGARASIVVRPVGRIVGTNSAFVEGNRVTIIDLDLDALLKDDTVLTRLQAATSQEEAKAILREVPGVKLNFEPEITIEFTPQ